MPGRRPRVVLAPRARNDLNDILVHTRRRWGANQRVAYKAKFGEAFDRLGAYPELGRAQDDLPPGVRSLPVEQRVVFYRVDANRVRVLRILHHLQDVEGKLVE